MPDKIRFGVYELDRDAMELRKNGVLIRLQEQPFRVLAILSGRPGEIITREELQEQIWGKDTFVDFDNGLNTAINKLREALGDSSDSPRFIQTLPRRGYRFVAPVTGNIPTEHRGATAPSSAVSDLGITKSRPRRPSVVKTAALVMAGVLVALVIARVVLLRKSRTPTPQETRHMTSEGFGPRLSRDGKLLAYVSSRGGDVPHIWVQQTAGGEAIPVTSGPDPDDQVDFSPDGTHIIFASGRGGGGIYIGPTLPGEPRLVVGGAFGGIGLARFSPTGDKILYLTDYYKAFTVPVDGSQPALLDFNRDFRLDGPPRWSPSGNEVYFYGVRKREAEKPGGWWVVSLDGGNPRRLRLPGVEEGHENFAVVHAWTRTKDDREWIVYSVSNGDAWKLLRVEISARGQVGEKAEQLTSGTDELGDSALSEDGKLAYSVESFSQSIYEIPTNDRGQKVGPTVQLSLSGRDERSLSVSREGRWMVYDATRPGTPNTVLPRDLRSGADRLLDDRGRERGSGGATSISPDGSKVIFVRDCKSGIFAWDPPLHCGFMVSAAGGQVERVCKFCIPRGFSSNGSGVLIEKYNQIGNEYHSTIAALDLATKTEKDFLKGQDLYYAFFSWDDHWVVFQKKLDDPKAKILIAPVRNGVAAKEGEWIAVTDGRYSDDKPQFSPDGNTVYFTSTRDGYLCIWAQRLDSTTKRPLGPPVAYEHFHNSMGKDASLWRRKTDLVVARDKMLINLPELRSDIWMVQVE